MDNFDYSQFLQYWLPTYNGDTQATAQTIYQQQKVGGVILIQIPNVTLPGDMLIDSPDDFILTNINNTEGNNNPINQSHENWCLERWMKNNHSKILLQRVYNYMITGIPKQISQLSVKNDFANYEDAWRLGDMIKYDKTQLLRHKVAITEEIIV